MKYRCLPYAFTFTLLAACGGGGGNDNQTITTAERIDLDNVQITNDLNQSYRRLILTHGSSTLTELDIDRNRITMDFATLPHGFAHTANGVFTTESQNGSVRSDNLPIRSYRGNYSGIFVTGGLNNTFPEQPAAHRAGGFTGRFVNETDAFDLPTQGIFTYNGMAFNNNPAHDAAFTYHIDYGQRRGSGEIAAASAHGRYILEESRIGYQFGIFGDDADAYGVKNGKVTADGASFGQYSLSIAGPAAEEIVGIVKRNDNPDANELLLHGTR